MSGEFRDELITLRVGIARVAQKAGLCLDIPGADGRVGLSFEHLMACAEDNERGWNRLLAMIVDQIDQLIMNSYVDEEPYQRQIQETT